MLKAYKLSLTEFEQVVQHAPLFAIDLVVLNNSNEMLIGERLNAPAKGAWFVPGGRVYKNESLEEAFKRISKAELGFQIKRNQAWLLGLFDHFYDDSFFSADVSTHYINATHVVRLSSELLALPKEQRSFYRWIAIDEIELDETVHVFSKVFLPALDKWVQEEKQVIYD